MVWQELLDALVDSFVAHQQFGSFNLYLDLSVVSEPPLPVFGNNRAALSMEGDMVCLGALQSSTALGRRLHATLGNAPRLLVSELLQLVYLVGASMLWAFKQFVAVFGGFAEDTVPRSIEQEASRDVPMQALAPLSFPHDVGQWC